jgi:hypothetical protein
MICSAVAFHTNGFGSVFQCSYLEFRDEPGSGFRLYQIARLVALLTVQSDNPATRLASPTDGKDHLVASAGETQRRIRQIIMCTASSASTSSSRTSRFQV